MKMRGRRAGRMRRRFLACGRRRPAPRHPLDLLPTALLGRSDALSLLLPSRQLRRVELQRLFEVREPKVQVPGLREDLGEVGRSSSSRPSPRSSCPCTNQAFLGPSPRWSAQGRGWPSGRERRGRAAGTRLGASYGLSVTARRARSLAVGPTAPPVFGDSGDLDRARREIAIAVSPASRRPGGWARACRAHRRRWRVRR